jgi:hypothetical protein
LHKLLKKSFLIAIKTENYGTYRIKSKELITFNDGSEASDAIYRLVGIIAMGFYEFAQAINR